jgi:mannose/fructose/N-acetylgalactosamine-specific phosphotransferase system component IIB
MVRQGVQIATLNIGGMAWRPGKKQPKPFLWIRRIFRHSVNWINWA